MKIFYVFISWVNEPPCEVIANRLDINENGIAIFYNDKDEIIEVFTNFVRIAKSKF